MDLSSSLFEHRVIKLEGTSNFRDIGGYKNTEGVPIRWGVLYRSANLSGLSSADQQSLQARGITNSIDLRSQYERQKSSYNYSFLNTHECSIDPQVTDSIMQAITRQEDISASRAQEFMSQMYQGFVFEQQERFAHFFDLLLANKEATVLHCTAGKDRTGFACAMLQSALEVHRDDILADYLLTQQCYQISQEEINQSYGLSKEIIKVLWGVEAEYLERALESIDREFGGIKPYLEKQLRLSSKKQELLFERFFDTA